MISWQFIVDLYSPVACKVNGVWIYIIFICILWVENRLAHKLTSYCDK